MPTANRPTLLTDDLRDRLCQALSAGPARRNACESVGIGLRTFQLWLAKWWKGEDAVCVALLAHVKKAEADAVAFHVGRIRLASQAGTW